MEASLTKLDQKTRGGEPSHPGRSIFQGLYPTAAAALASYRRSAASPRAAGRASDDLDNRDRVLWRALPTDSIATPPAVSTWNYAKLAHSASPFADFGLPLFVHD